MGKRSRLLIVRKWTNLNQGVLFLESDVDGEMGVNGAHLVAVALGDTGDQVLDVRAHGADGGELLADTEPLADAQLVLTDAVHLDREVTEIPLQHTSGSLHVNHAVLHGEGH